VQGNKVKLTCQFKGREIEFQSIGRELFEVLPCTHRSSHMRCSPLPQPVMCSSLERMNLTASSTMCRNSPRTWATRR